MTIRVASAAAFALVVSISGAGAQPGALVTSAPPVQVAQNVPPADVPDAGGGDSQDAGQLLLRVDHLEAELRQANGEIEELQNNQRRLEDALKKFQADVEFRLSGAGANIPPGPPPKSAKKADAFDPNTDPNAPGAPKQLGTTAPSAPLPKVVTTAPVVAAAPEPPAGPPMQLTRPQPAEAPPTVITANTGLDFGDAPKQQYNDALDAYRAGQYDKAEAAFKAFLAGNPAHRLTGDATFFLGETYLQRSRPREAAEQYLKVSTDYSKSPRAPMALLRLGQSLAMLGNGDEACGTFAEVGKRYPAADATLRKSVEREQEKDHC